MKIFLDVGGHTGETLNEVIKDIYCFDRIICFEPVKECFEILKSNFIDSRIELHNFGLWDKDTDAQVFAAGESGGSVFKEKYTARNISLKNKKIEMCSFKKSSKWFKNNINNDDIVLLKINCEGCECDIMDDLIDSEEYSKVFHTLICLDIRKIPSQRHREYELINKLKSINKQNIFDSKSLNGITHQKRINNWIANSGYFEKINER